MGKLLFADILKTHVAPSFPGAHFLLAAALARLGRFREVRSEVQEGLAIVPIFTVADFAPITDY
jgi:hypothetical protein